MSELIKTGSHGNNILVIKLSDRGLLRKLSFDKNSYSYLYSDYQGCKWYQNIQDINLFSPYIVELSDFLILDYKLLSAKSCYHLSSINKTYVYLEKIIDHYLTVWEFSKKVPCHGDLTLANILFEDRNPIIIDWEHFNIDGECWGFDIAYLILSALIIPYLNNKRISEKEYFIFKKLWITLKNIGINKDLIYEPFTYFNFIFNENKKWEKIITNSSSKLYVNLVNDSFISNFELNILKNI